MTAVRTKNVGAVRTKNVEAVPYDPTGEMPGDHACSRRAWGLWGSSMSPTHVAGCAQTTDIAAIGAEPRIRAPALPRSTLAYRIGVCA
jgi:hypothetical protein